LRGKAYNLTKEDVEKRIQGVSPEEMRKYYVVVNGKNILLSIVLEMDRLEFTAMGAYNIPRRLSFEQGRVE